MLFAHRQFLAVPDCFTQIFLTHQFSLLVFFFIPKFSFWLHAEH